MRERVTRSCHDPAHGRNHGFPVCLLDGGALAPGMVLTRKEYCHVASLVTPDLSHGHRDRALGPARILPSVDHGRALPGAALAVLVRIARRYGRAKLEAVHDWRAVVQRG